MLLTHYKGPLLILFTLLCFAAFLLLTNPLPQDVSYNIFADQRRFLGIPNFSDVLSNLGLVIVGIAGVIILQKSNLAFQDQTERWLFISFFIAVGLTGIGSAYYHLAPDNTRLVWDRLPLSLLNLTLLSAIICDRIDPKVAQWAVLPLCLIGIISVLYWHFTDDLRLYAFVLFFPILLIPLLFWVYPSSYTHSYLILQAIGWVIVTRLFEHYDKLVYAMTHHIVSGHTLKHLISAFAAYLILRYTIKRQVKV